MSQRFKIFLFLTVAFSLFVFSFNISLAQNFSPQLQIRIGDLDSSDFKPDDPGNWIGQYISAVYQYGVSLAAILAVIMIMVGGLIWLTSAGRRDQVGTGQDFIKSALLGLLLAMFSFVLLYSINPALTVFKPLVISSPNLQGSSSAREASNPLDYYQDFCCVSSGVDAGDVLPLDEAGGCSSYGDSSQCNYHQVCGCINTGINPVTGLNCNLYTCVEDTSTEATLRQQLAEDKIYTKPPCPDGQCTGCVNLAGLPNSTFNKLRSLKDAAGAESLYITGGTECGHSSHGSGRAIIDLRNTNEYKALNDYVKQNGKDCNVGFGRGYKIGSDLFVDEGDHWHVEFNTTRQCIG